VNREKSKKYVIPIIPIILAALIMAGCGGSTITTGNGTPITAPVIGARAPDFTASTLDGETIVLDDLRGPAGCTEILGYMVWVLPLSDAILSSRFRGKGARGEVHRY
jgi:hypothetical protein